MKIWVGVTDKDWFDQLSRSVPDEVNFWQPSGSRKFKVLKPGEPFLFKLHSPNDFIVGGGFFVRHTTLPCSVAWEAFETKNGVKDLSSFLKRVSKYRSKTSELPDLDPVIGCNILAEPFFFEQSDWIPVPSDWAKNIVQGKTYTQESVTGQNLWAQVMVRLDTLPIGRVLKDGEPRYGEQYLTQGRLGQGAFRVLVTDAYHRRCAITGERTLPVLEAAHIKPYTEAGPHQVSNGLLLRSDLHKLFDVGYLTLTTDLRVEVSQRIKEEYKNGREYYAHHGEQLINLPDEVVHRPSRDFLEWHNEHVFAD